MPLIASVDESVAVKSAGFPERTFSSSGNIAVIAGEIVGSVAFVIVVGVAVAVSVDMRHGPVPVITAIAVVPSDSTAPDPHPAIQTTTSAATAKRNCVR